MNAHAALSQAALLRKLGYPIPAPRLHRTLKLRFESIAARTAFLDQLSDTTATARSNWTLPLSETEPVAEILNAVVEKSQNEIPNYHWGIIVPSAIKGRRSTRALLLPLALLTIPESVNSFSWEAGKLLADHLVFTQPFATSFAEATFDDLRWIGRRIAKLSRAEWLQIGHSGGFPREVGALVAEKLISRRNHLVAMLELGPELETSQRELPFERHLTLGAVRQGKLTQAQFPGYPMYFAQLKEPEAPLRWSQLWRYFAVDQIGNGISGALEALNSRVLTLSSPSDVAKRRREEKLKEHTEWAEKNPDQPFTQKLESWSGPVGGFRANLGRDVITGTYYGSDSAIQLVDSLSLSASLGVFAGIDGLSGKAAQAAPNASANVSLVRSYLHVKPIFDMKAAFKSDWKDVFIIGLLGKLAKTLKTGPQAPAEEIAAALRELTAGLTEGERFIVTDTVASEGRLGVSIPIPLLVAPGLHLFNPTVGVRLSTQPQLIRRTTLVRTETGLQIYLQDAKLGNVDLELGLDWLINILSAGAAGKRGWAETEAFVIDTDTLLASGDAEKVRALNVGLRALLRFQQIAPLREKFEAFQLKHSTRSRTARAALLPLKARSNRFEHGLRISPPGYPEGHERNFFTLKSTTTRGVDSWSLFADGARLATQGLVNFKNPSGENPANAFLGKGAWRVLSTEAELTPSREFAPITRLENFRGGWKLRQKRLLRILDEAEKEVRPLNLDRPLFRREEFLGTPSLQLYEVSSSLILPQAATRKLRAALLAPASDAQAARNLVAVEGVADLLRYCRTLPEPPRPIARLGLPCLKPWMEAVLSLRGSLRRHRGFADPSLPGPESVNERKEFVRLTHALVNRIERRAGLAILLRWVGRENFYFQLRVSGFRKNEETGDSEYVSDSVGGASEVEENLAGPLRDLVAQTSLEASEVFAGSLNESY
jgi:hypothetical protein